jgi:hypothetical protein
LIVILLPLTVSASLILPSQDPISDSGDIVSARKWVAEDAYQETLKTIATDMGKFVDGSTGKYLARCYLQSLLNPKGTSDA